MTEITNDQNDPHRNNTTMSRPEFRNYVNKVDHYLGNGAFRGNRDVYVAHHRKITWAGRYGSEGEELFRTLFRKIREKGEDVTFPSTRRTQSGNKKKERSTRYSVKRRGTRRSKNVKHRQER